MKCDICGRFADALREWWGPTSKATYGGPDGEACRRCRPELFEGAR